MVVSQPLRRTVSPARNTWPSASIERSAFYQSDSCPAPTKAVKIDNGESVFKDLQVLIYFADVAVALNEGNSTVCIIVYYRVIKMLIWVTS